MAFRCHTLLPLDDCRYALQETIPVLTRSSLHRCLQRHDISRLPVLEEVGKPARKPFKEYLLAYLHVDFAELQTEEGTQYLFVALDCTSKVTFAELQPQATPAAATDFLRQVLEKLPYKTHIILTNNSM